MTEAVHRLGEVLRAAREAKGVDLVRVERETKIRERYLSALERGDYRELPGAVYTKGFLRNYGAYLGLDPEYLIDLYRLETADSRADRQPPPAPPRPLTVRRARAFVVTPGAIVAAILTIVVGGFLAYLGYQLVNFAREPELRITDPPGNVTDHRAETITIRGVTEPNARVTVSNLRENPTVTADAEGNFEVTVELVPGSNVVRLVAFDPVTQRETPPQERTILVAEETAASPSAAPVALALVAPTEGSTVPSPVEVGGTAAPGTVVSLAATLEAPPVPAFAVADAAGQRVALTPSPPAPPPVEATAAPDGSFTASVPLPPGGWRVAATAPGGQSASVSVRVAEPAGLAVRVSVAGGASYLELSEDGTALEGRSGTIAEAGETIELTATREIRIRAGNAGAVSLTVNGIPIGAMGTSGAVVEWVITRAGG